VEFFTVEERGAVAIVRIDRPPANAMDPALLAEGQALGERLAAGPPDAVVLTGREGFFSAGADLKVVPELDADGRRAMVDGINGLFSAWYGLPAPVVCAVNGHAIAGGMILALCGDYRVASAEGRYGLTELRVGVPYPTVALEVAAAELPGAGIRRMALRADLMDAQECHRLGAFDEVVEPDAVLDRALAAAEDLAGLPAEAYAATKRELRRDALAVAGKVAAGEVPPVTLRWGQSDVGRRVAGILG
jgi:enoyl-CoA hydratase